jgi:hypothetical protein
MDKVIAKEIKEGEWNKTNDKQAKKVMDLGTIIIKQLLELLRSMLEHNLLQLGFEQLSKRSMIDSTKTFK